MNHNERKCGQCGKVRRCYFAIDGVPRCKECQSGQLKTRLDNTPHPVRHGGADYVAR